jgi:hypothetical protein
MPGAKAKVAKWQKVHSVPVLIMVVNYMWTVSNFMNETQYPIYPEDDGSDTPRLPYSPV